MSYDAIKTTTIRNADLSMLITADPKLSLNEIAKGIRVFSNLSSLFSM